MDGSTEPPKKEKGAIELQDSTVFDFLGLNRQDMAEIAAPDGELVRVPQSRTFRLTGRIVVAVETHKISAPLRQAPQLAKHRQVGGRHWHPKTILRGSVAGDDMRGIVPGKIGNHQRSKCREETELIAHDVGNLHMDIERVSAGELVDVAKNAKARPSEEGEPLGDP
jgi:hypothetical protein